MRERAHKSMYEHHSAPKAVTDSANTTTDASLGTVAKRALLSSIKREPVEDELLMLRGTTRLVEMRGSPTSGVKAGNSSSSGSARMGGLSFVSLLGWLLPSCKACIMSQSAHETHGGVLTRYSFDKTTGTRKWMACVGVVLERWLLVNVALLSGSCCVTMSTVK